MPDKEQNDMIEFQKTMVALARERNKMSEERSKLSEERSRMSKQRSIMSAQRSYMNAERTLSVWVRTALASMTFGIAINRFGLMLNGVTDETYKLFGHPIVATTFVGIVLVVFSVLMSFSAGWRFIAFTQNYKKEFPPPNHHNIWLPVTYSFMTVIFGIALVLLMLLIK